MQPKNPNKGGPEPRAKAAPESAGHSRILAGREHGATPARRDIGSQGVAALILVLLLGTLGWMGYNKEDPQEEREERAAARAERAAARAAARQPAPRVEVMAPTAHAVVATPNPLVPTPAPAAPVAPVAPAAPARIGNDDAAAPHGADDAAPQRDTPPHGTAAAPPPPAPRPAAVAKAGAAPAPEPAPKQSTPAGVPDSDVALLTAPAAYAGKQPNRDVVLRQDNDSSESLLQRCKELGTIEGMLCRSRICSGRWDSDPACK
ncbi:hypothetical protein [Janthinobacterium sp.]|uniref:hypothetical protein n=1 Tax=Janthinobacterium sp. TaxID=1871054 RepID=UPI00293D4D98|nr:hypothetical protein [Janthinobacterium sp.]